jgi:hypothetical protein
MSDLTLVSKLTEQEQENYWYDLMINGTAALIVNNDGAVSYVSYADMLKTKGEVDG